MGTRVVTLAILFALLLAHPVPGQQPGGGSGDGNTPALAADRAMVPFVLGALTLIVVAGGVLFTVVITKAITAKTLTTLMPNERVMRLNFVIVILIAVAYLQLANVLTDGVLTLLGTIAGYVLGGISRANPGQGPTTDDPSKDVGSAGGNAGPALPPATPVVQPNATQPHGTPPDVNVVGPTAVTGS